MFTNPEVKKKKKKESKPSLLHVPVKNQLYKKFINKSLTIEPVIQTPKQAALNHLWPSQQILKGHKTESHGSNPEMYSTHTKLDFI